MARKVFISFLGTGFYSKCYYGKDNYDDEGSPFKSSETRFVQQATLEYLRANEWKETDAAYILLTKKAKNDNWDKNISQRTNFRTNQVEEYIGLERVIEGMNLPFKVRPIDIPDDKEKNEEEIWDLFSILSSEDVDDGNPMIRKDDELYFDVTHGYRYLPMLMLVFGNYAKFLKQVKICGITYGNIEKKNSKDVAPVFDLLPLTELQDWTFAIADYLENGNFNRLKLLSDKSLKPIRKNEATRDQGNEIYILTDALKNLADELKTCRGNDIIESKSIAVVLNQLSIIKKSNKVLPVIIPLLDKLWTKLKSFNHEICISNTFVAAQWCYDNQQYQAAITFLEEGIVSFLCKEFDFDFTDKRLRDLFTYATTLCLNNKNESEGDWELDEYGKTLMRQIMQYPLFQNKKFVQLFYNIIDLRNDYNHCGMRPKKNPKMKINGPFTHKVIIANIQNYIEQTKKFFPLSNPNFIFTANSTFVFLNLSNHPSAHWSEEQLAAAHEYGEIKDIPFPAVDENLDDEDIDTLADEYYEKIKEASGGHPCTVHVMGEMTFTYALVNKLKEAGYTPVASTSWRDVQIQEDGRKQVKFHFCRFRKY